MKICRAFLSRQPKTHRSRRYRCNRFRPRSTEQTLRQPHLLPCRALTIDALLNVKTLSIIDIHFTTAKKHDSKIGPQVTRRNAADLRSLAADRGYGSKAFRYEIRGNGVRLLIKYRIYASFDYAHNTCMDSDRYHRRSMFKTVFLSIKYILDSSVRARSWPLEFREMVLKAAVYKFRPSVRFR